jgi:predicted ATPase
MVGMFAAPERAVLRPLAALAGAFALLSAQAVAATTDIDLARFADIIVKLVAKIACYRGGGTAVRYRLLEIMCDSGLGKLNEAGA